MIFNLLANPLYALPVLAAIVIAFTVHEFSHALTAEKLGDPTPKALGRLTLNPLAHIDILGFLLLLFAGFGWGRPVPFNENRLKNPKWGAALIALAGPFSNLALAALAFAALYLLTVNGVLPPNSLLAVFLAFLIQFNIVLMLFNLIPIPPLDGSKLLFALIPDRHEQIRQALTIYGPMILLGLIIFDSFSPVSLFGSLFGFFLRGIERLVS
jgi:Zn-dependent protease